MAATRKLLRDRLPKRVFRLLRRAGELADQLSLPVYVVGGFVRDLFLGRANLDVDLTVEGDGIVFARALAKETGAHAKAHERFGTAVVIFPDGVKVDVATARTERYESPAALPRVERSSIKEDLYRRDFTINTLAIRLNGPSFGELIDFYGGLRDLNVGRIRVLHNVSFIEDPTRVFRGVRFEQRFGFRLEKESLALIHGALKADLFRRLSGERLLEELIRSLSEEQPSRIVRRLHHLGLLRCIHPTLKYTSRLGQILKGVEDTLKWYRAASSNWRARQPQIESWLLYLMALMETLTPKAMNETLKRLRVPVRMAQKIRQGHGLSRSLRRRLAAKSTQPSDIYRELHEFSEETVLFLMAAGRDKAFARQLSTYLDSYRFMKPRLTGNDLKTMGLKPGPLFKNILDRVLEARLNGQMRTMAEERRLVQRIAGL